MLLRSVISSVRWKQNKKHMQSHATNGHKDLVSILDTMLL